jgi:hypothetical protein
MKRIFLLPLLVIGVILVSGCGCYIEGDWVDFDDGDAEMASLMEEKPSAVPSPAPVAIGGGYSSTAVAVTHTPLPDTFIDRLFVFIDEPDEDTFDDMFTGPFGFICEFGLVPPEITSPTWDETETDDTPTISWTEAEGGYAPYDYWLLIDDDPWFGSPEIMVCVDDDIYYTIPEGTYNCGTTVYIALLCFDVDGNPAYGEVIMFHYPACGGVSDDDDTIGTGIGEDIIGDGGAIDTGVVRIVEVGHWLSETAIITIPFSEMFTGLTGDDGSRLGAMFSFAVPRYVILVKLFIIFFLLFLIGDKKKKKKGK